jgi:phosphatidylserine/phosphatidylglycerophosphate/cardiolipin synthase-like enzyme
MVVLVISLSSVFYLTRVHKKPIQTPGQGGTYTLMVEPEDGRGSILESINEARTEIDLTIYSLSDEEIEAALKSAHQRGVTVKILYNDNFYSHSSGQSHDYKKEDEVRKEMASLEEAGILTKAASSAFKMTHQKTFTFDNSKSIIMSLNLDSNYFERVRDFAVITTNPREVAEITQVFNADWNYSSVTPTVESLVWSNVNSRAKILNLIRGATKTIEIYNEELEDQECLDALISEADSGVVVRVISAQLGDTQETDGNRAQREYLNRHGVSAKYMPTADYLYCHAKMIMVDYGTSNAKAFIGSENLSSTSLDENRELGIILNDNEIIERLHDVFETDWSKCRFDQN